MVLNLKGLSLRHEILFPIAGITGQRRFERLFRVLYIRLDAQEIGLLRRRADDSEKCERKWDLRPTVVLVASPFFCRIDFQEGAVAKRVDWLELGFLDEVLHAHPLDEHFPFGLVFFLEDALGGGFPNDRLAGYLPATPEI